MPTGTISNVRKIIKAEEIVNLLQNSLLDKKLRGSLSQNDINTAKVLLAKCIPDLKAVEHTGQVDSAQQHVHRVEFASRK